MDFHAARRVFEAAAAAELATAAAELAPAKRSPPQTTPDPTLSQVTAATTVRPRPPPVDPFAPRPARHPPARPWPPRKPQSPVEQKARPSPPTLPAQSPPKPRSLAKPRSPEPQAQANLHSPRKPQAPPKPSSRANAHQQSRPHPPVQPRSSPPPPLPPRPHQQPPPPSSSSDYSEFADYWADKQLNEPGVNDGRPDEGLTGTTVTAASASAHRASSASREPPRVPSGSDSEPALSDMDEDGLVRQHSNFSRLSAQSWLTVDSAQDVSVTDDVSDPAAVPPEPQETGSPQGGVEFTHIHGKFPKRPRDAPLLANVKFSAAQDHDPTELFGVDEHGDVMQIVQTKPLQHMSIFECCAVLQAGVAAYKRKSFRRFGARRVWLSSDCTEMYWTSKKDGVAADRVKLQKVVKLRMADRELALDVTDGYRLSLLFANPDEASLWARALSCLVPLQARVRAPKGVLPADKEREDYSLADDTFNEQLLRDYKAVNSYVVLCAARGQPLSSGNKLAFSLSDNAFFGLRYIPRKLVPLLLRSQEEVAVLKRLSHPNLVKYHECLLDTEHGGNYMIFEYLPRGSLIDSTRLENVRPIQEVAARELMRDALAGLGYLHSLRIAHGDVRPDTLLRGPDGALKLDPLGAVTHDFTEVGDGPGLAAARRGVAPPAFLPPELCAPGPAARAGYAGDVWAAAAVLYFMLYGRVPFGGEDDDAVRETIRTGKLRFPRQPETSRQVRSLLKGVLGEKDPKMRIGLTELRRHPWFGEAGPVSRDTTRLIVSPEEVDSAVQVAKVRVMSKKPA